MSFECLLDTSRLYACESQVVREQLLIVKVFFVVGDLHDPNFFTVKLMKQVANFLFWMRENFKK